MVIDGFFIASHSYVIYLGLGNYTEVYGEDTEVHRGWMMHACRRQGCWFK
jgi:hypothetical protein